MNAISKIALLALFSGAFMTIVSARVFTQTDPPADEDIPVVISRDEQAEQQPAIKPDARREDVRESAQPTEDNLLFPPQADNTSAITNSPSYNISLTEAQQKLMLYLDLLTKTESRAESLRTKLFELLEKENQVKSQISQIEYGLRPEQIQNAAALSGSLRPEEIRDDRQRILEAQKVNLTALLGVVQRNRRNLEAAVISADRLVERIRSKFEGFVDKALDDEIEN